MSEDGGWRARVWLYSSRERPRALLASSRARQLTAHGNGGDKERPVWPVLFVLCVHQPTAAERSQRSLHTSGAMDG